ncbi:MAG: ATP-binding cassette domain-containing protein [Pseudomonadota bacterium]
MTDALAVAARLCQERGVRFTPLRRRVLELIWGSHIPLGAYAILDHLQAEGKRIRPATVYRALDFLKDQGLVHRIESKNAYIGCVDPARSHAGQHLICRRCGKVTELDDRAVVLTLASGARAKDFELEGTAAIEAQGFCRDCRPEEAVQKPTFPSLETPSAGPVAETPLKHVRPAGRPLIAARGITVRHAGVDILDRVDLAVHAGEILTIIGPNGSGKTTLVRALLGLVAPAAGTVWKAAGLRVGYVPQSFAVEPNLPLTVRRFLKFADRKESAIEAALDRMGAGDTLDRPIQGLSGGELRRVLLARAMLRKPDLLVLDEPVQGVDILGQADLYRRINELREKDGTAILMISHDLRLVMGATDEVVCLNHHVCCAGYPEAVSRHPEYLALFGGAVDAKNFAVYTHRHDHVHDAAGNVLPIAGAEES